MILDELQTRKHFGSPLELTVETAKEVYFFDHCNERNNRDIHEFMITNFSKETLLSWNEDYVRHELVKIMPLFESNDPTDVHCIFIHRDWILQTYIEDYELNKQVVELCKKIINIYGPISDYGCYYYDKFGINDFYGKSLMLIHKRNTERPNESYSTGQDEYYLKSMEMTGIIQRLLELEYMDLYRDLVLNVFVLSIEMYCEPTERAKEIGIHYGGTKGRKDLIQERYKEIYNDYLVKFL